jgi:hypothetical protein
MKSHCLAICLLALSSAACSSTPKRGESVAGIMTGWLVGLASRAEFDHGCPAQRVRVIRTDPQGIADLDVCGAVRRYLAISATWLDVTALYPASALPKPLAPE